MGPLGLSRLGRRVGWTRLRRGKGIVHLYMIFIFLRAPRQLGNIRLASLVSPWGLRPSPARRRWRATGAAGNADSIQRPPRGATPSLGVVGRAFLIFLKRAAGRVESSRRGHRRREGGPAWATPWTGLRKRRDVCSRRPVREPAGYGAVDASWSNGDGRAGLQGWMPLERVDPSIQSMGPWDPCPTDGVQPWGGPGSSRRRRRWRVLGEHLGGRQWSPGSHLGSRCGVRRVLRALWYAGVGGRCSARCGYSGECRWH